MRHEPLKFPTDQHMLIVALLALGASSRPQDSDVYTTFDNSSPTQ
ncbi:hypothetical protein [Vibrio chagasii]